MKQKKHNDKRRNINNIRNKRTASVAYKRIKRATKDHQKRKHDNQTDNKDNNVNIDMSMGLGEKKKIKSEPVDQKEEKPSSQEAITTTSSSPLPTPSTLQPEVFDSYRDNAMSEMNKIAGMEPDNATKVFSHVEEIQQLDPSKIRINDSVNSLNRNPNTTERDTTGFRSIAKPNLEARDLNAMKSIEDNAVPKQDVKPDIPQVDKELEKQDHSLDSVRFDDKVNQESQSDSLNDDNNPFISIIKVWQAYTVAWINACNEFMKGCDGYD